jgi:4,5-DOPA dioxygenase extradiol
MRHPSLFVSHGAPTLPLDPSPARDFLARAGAALARPVSILSVSAHWETLVPTVSSAAHPETIHDFRGFPEALYRMRYPAPGAPELALRVEELLQKNGLPVEIDPDRGLDHGAWTPLTLLFPEADIPVTQLSIQTHLGPQHHYRVGQALRPLRDEGVLILCSGSVTHNLGEFGRYAAAGQTPQWVAEFNEWLAAQVLAGRVDELLAYREDAPSAVRNHPTEEHLLPLFTAVGTALPGGRAQRLHTSYTYGIIGMDVYRFD